MYGSSRSIEDMKKDIIQILIQTIEDMNPAKLVKSSLRLKGSLLKISGEHVIDLREFSNIYVVGFGKASGYMATGIKEVLDGYITDGLILVPRGQGMAYNDLGGFSVYEGDHPLPTEDNIKASKALIEILSKAGRDDLIIILISGGGSALLTYPRDEVPLVDLANVTELLMKAGATIDELNTVRKHLSKVKGGNLARYIYPASAVSLIISDVVGDRLDVIASGPTTPDPSTYMDAYNALRKYGLLDKVSESILNVLKAGISGKLEETPKPGDKIFDRITNIVIGNNEQALRKAVNRASEYGYKARILSSFIEGEAREAGKILAGIGLEIKNFNRPFKKPIILFAGGETTVTVRGNGIGGPNQELVLSAGLSIIGHDDIIIAAVGTDGIDGNSPAAGGIISGKDISMAIRDGRDPKAYLLNNDSYTFLKEINAVIETGPSGTNVNSIIALGIF